VKAYPQGFLRVFWWVLGLLALSGVALLPNMMQVRFDWDVPFQFPLGSHVWIASLHALFAFATLALFGSLIPIHVRNGLRAKRQLKTGIALLVIAVGLPLTALGIYYLGNDTLSSVASAMHVVIGLGAALVLTAHVVVARRNASHTHKRHHDSRPHRSVTELEEHKHRSKAAHHSSERPHRQRAHRH